MDKCIFDKYEKNEAPFDGLNVHCSNYLSLKDLKPLLETILEYLVINNLVNNEIYMVHDWFQHDGYLPRKKLVDSKFMYDFLESTETLYSINLSDTYVYLGLYDKSSRWYFRIYIVDEYDLDEDEERKGTFDISMCMDQAVSLFEYIDTRIKNVVECEITKTYLSNKYAG